MHNEARLMKYKAIVPMVLALLLNGSSVSGAQSPKSSPPESASSTAELLEKAIFTEETVGDLKAAIKIYEQIVAEAEANRSHVAQARYRLGMCHLTLERGGLGIWVMENGLPEPKTVR